MPAVQLPPPPPRRRRAAPPAAWVRPATCSLRSSSASRPRHASGVMPFTCPTGASTSGSRVDPLGVVARAGEEHAIERAALPQLLVRTAVEHAALVDDDDAIGERQRRPAVRDQDRRAAGGDAAQRRVDLLLDPRVDRRGRVVEQQDARVREQRARQRDALALTTRERESLFADDRVVAVREPHDEFVRFGRARRGFDLGRRRVGSRERDVGADRVGEEERVLEHDADAAAQRLQRDVAHVGAVDRHAPLVHVVEARQQQADGRLARARGAHERDRLARFDRQREVAAAPVRSTCTRTSRPRSRTAPCGTSSGAASGLSWTSGRRVEQVEDPLRAGARQLTRR